MNSNSYPKFMDRPYSQLELKDIRNRYLTWFQLADGYIHHDTSLTAKKPCYHFYLVIKGRKKDMNRDNPGGCSVCWEINLDNKAYSVEEIVDDYMHFWYPFFKDSNKNNKLTRKMLHIEYEFYDWLYKNAYRKK